MRSLAIQTPLSLHSGSEHHNMRVFTLSLIFTFSGLVAAAVIPHPRGMPPSLIRIIRRSFTHEV